MRHRGPLSLAVCLEAHPLNETAHAQIATWAPDADKAAIEVEGARIARQLQVRRCARSVPNREPAMCAGPALIYVCPSLHEEVAASQD